MTPDDVEVLHGDTAVAPLGMDTYGSRSARGRRRPRCTWRWRRSRTKASKIAAHELEVAVEDLDFENGTFSVRARPDRRETIPELAFSAWHAHNLPNGTEPNLEATAVYDPPNFTWPSARTCAWSRSTWRRGGRRRASTSPSTTAAS